MRRFARYWDLVANSGNFVESTPLIWSEDESPFYSFLRWSDWLHERTGRTDSIALVRLLDLLFEYLTKDLRIAPGIAATRLWNDYRRGGRNDKPGCLKDYLKDVRVESKTGAGLLPKRQARHAGS